jgi:hypothetical protein
VDFRAAQSEVSGCRLAHYFELLPKRQQNVHDIGLVFGDRARRDDAAADRG